MDIQKELESFKTVAIGKGWSVDGETTQINYRFYSLTTNSGWEMWQAAKAQAVPETQQALNDRLLVKSIREHVESHIAEVSMNDLFDKGWLAAMKCIQNNIDMLEAQEQTND